jgi:hypothetical protein
MLNLVVRKVTARLEKVMNIVEEGSSCSEAALCLIN